MGYDFAVIFKQQNLVIENAEATERYFSLFVDSALFGLSCLKIPLFSLYFLWLRNCFRPYGAILSARRKVQRISVSGCPSPAAGNKVSISLLDLTLAEFGG